jgi:hypothetical protein
MPHIKLRAYWLPFEIGALLIALGAASPVHRNAIYALAGVMAAWGNLNLIGITRQR